MKCKNLFRAAILLLICLVFLTVGCSAVKVSYLRSDPNNRGYWIAVENDTPHGSTVVGGASVSLWYCENTQEEQVEAATQQQHPQCIQTKLIRCDDDCGFGADKTEVNLSTLTGKSK